MATGNPPRLSIGLPVYNGERFLRFALDSILAQTYRNYELIISDNASTDSTMLICQEYATRDSRIHYHRNLDNIGSADNFNRVFNLSRGVYFKWAAADDLISPTFLEKCIALLDSDPSLIFCYTKADRINTAGVVDGTYDYPMRVDHPDPVTRFADLILINHFCTAIFGVGRRDILAQTTLIGKYVGSDRVLLAELGLRGRLCEIPEYLFHRRDHPQASGRLYDVYTRLTWYAPAKGHGLSLVHWQVGAQYFKTVNRVPLPWSVKAICYQVLARWYIKRRRALLQDIKAAVVRYAPFSLHVAHIAKRILNIQ